MSGDTVALSNCFVEKKFVDGKECLDFLVVVDKHGILGSVLCLSVEDVVKLNAYFGINSLPAGNK